MITISRRTILRGVGAALALPLFEAMTAPRGLALGNAYAEPPRRMAFLYVPNGVHMPDWTPEKTGIDYVLPRTLEPLAPFKSSLLVLSGLTHDKARANGDGPGDHARASGTFLTACQALKTDGAVKLGVSVDQLAAQRFGAETRFRSLEIGCEASAQSGQCDSGYSCAYSSNLSWSSPQTPCPKEVDPRLVFERLFRDGEVGESTEARGKRAVLRRSILDFVRDDAARLQTKLGANDKRKLDEYFSAIREVERRIELASGSGGSVPDSARPKGTPEDYGEHTRVLADLLVLAFQTDSTRIATFSFANEGSNRSYAAIGVPEGHHETSHHGNDAEKQKKIQLINRFHIEQFAYLVKKLAETKEGETNLLERSMVLYGGGISDGNRHNHDDLPIVIAGHAGGRLATGKHSKFPRDTPLANLYLAMLARMDVVTAKFGDSTGMLDV